MEPKEESRQPPDRGHILCLLLFIAMAGVIIGLAVALGLGSRSQDVVMTTAAPSDGGEIITTRAPSDGGAMTTAEPSDGVTITPPDIKSKYGDYRFASVATDNGLCSEIGVDILGRAGGSAVDAAIATLACLGVTQPHSTGIGGGFFMTVYDRPTRKMDVLISREVAPQAATESMFVNTSSTVGGLAVAVPGEVAGMYAAWGRYGKLPWAELFAPAIRLCEDGAPVSGDLAVTLSKRMLETIQDTPSLGDVYLKESGEPYKLGEKVKRPRLAETLKRIAQGGAIEYYNGSLASDIIADLNEIGGIITLEDLRTYTPEWKTPVSSYLSNGNYTIYGPPPPSSGAIVQYMLNILDGYDINSDDVSTFEKRTLTVHRIVEAMKFTFGKRSHLGDEDYVNITQWKAKLVSGAYGDETRAKIHDDKTMGLDYYEHAFNLKEDHGTTHVSVLDQYGSAVGVTSTVNLRFGSQRIGTKTGIVFNNEMDDFSTPGTVNFFGVSASPTNYIEPGKRPMSSMSPTIVLDEDGNVVFVTGASGGTRIITGIVQSVINSLWLKMNVSAAVDAARVHHQLIPQHMEYEPFMDMNLVNALHGKGHNVSEASYNTHVQAIRSNCHEHQNSADVYTDKCIHAVSDFRKLGAPDGY